MIIKDSQSINNFFLTNGFNKSFCYISPYGNYWILIQNTQYVYLLILDYSAFYRLLYELTPKMFLQIYMSGGQTSRTNSIDDMMDYIGFNWPNDSGAVLIQALNDWKFNESLEKELKT